MTEDVEEYRGGDGGQKSDCGGDQGIGNARAHRPKAGAALLAEIEKRSDDAKHSSKQADERRNRSGGSEPLHVPLQLGEFLADAELQRALNGGPVDECTFLLDLALDFLISK